MSSFCYRDLHSSMLRIGTDFVADISALGIAAITLVNMDQHADISELPDGDILGIGAFALENDEGLQTISISFGISTVDDLNQFRHNDIMNYVYDHLLPGRTFNVMNAESGFPLGTVKTISPLMALPMADTENRSLQFIQATFLTDLIARPLQ